MIAVRTLDDCNSLHLCPRLKREDFKARNTAKFIDISRQDGMTCRQCCCRNDQIVCANDLAAASEDGQDLSMGSGHLEREIEDRNGREHSFDKGGTSQTPCLGIGSTAAFQDRL